MNKRCPLLAKILDKSVSFYAFGTAVLLVVYMLSTFVVRVFNFFSEFQDIISLEDAGKEAVQMRLLAFIAFTIVLIKAYRILISYAKTQHVNIKYLVEISIIAPAIEILFNSHGYSINSLILLGSFGILNLIIYVWKYDKFIKIGKDENEEPL